MEIIQALVATRKLLINCGPGVLITCRHIPERYAAEAMAEFATWAARREGSPGALDVTSTTGERTIMPYARIVMLRSVGDH